MARKPRLGFEGAFDHVIVRGNHRRDILCDESDRVAYLECVQHYRDRYPGIVYAYVLMSNHVHLLIETGAVGLAKIMQGIQFSYTQRYNRRYGVVGHYFRGAVGLCRAGVVRIKAKDLAEHLHCDASMISRLHAREPG